MVPKIVPQFLLTAGAVHFSSSNPFDEPDREIPRRLSS